MKYFISIFCYVFIARNLQVDFKSPNATERNDNEENNPDLSADSIKESLELVKKW